MRGDRLYEIVDFILNEASERDLEVVRSALKRRIDGADARGAMGVDPARLARSAAASIQEQLGGSIDQIRATVRNFAVEMIRKEAPEVTEAQLRELLNAWVPESSTAPERRAPGEKGAAKQLPPEALLAMVAQFVSYSTESMSVSEQLKLREQIPDWQSRYWKKFSPRLRALVSYLLNGELDPDTFWERVHGELGIDRGPTATR